MQYSSGSYVVHDTYTGTVTAISHPCFICGWRVQTYSNIAKGMGGGGIFLERNFLSVEVILMSTS